METGKSVIFFLYGEHKDNSVFFLVWLIEICLIIDGISGKFLPASQFATGNVKVGKSSIKFLLCVSYKIRKDFPQSPFAPVFLIQYSMLLMPGTVSR